MRRVPAILLLFAFSFVLITPLLSSHPENAEAKLPACCRRDGKHRCGMAMANQAPRTSTGISIDASRAKCAQYPKPNAAPASHASCFLPARAVAVDSIHQPADSIEQTEARYRLSYARSRAKRGPPASALS